MGVLLITALPLINSYGQTNTSFSQPVIAVADNVEVNSTCTYEVAYNVFDGIPNQYTWIIYTANSAYTKDAEAVPDIDFIMTIGVNASIQNITWLRTGHFVIEVQEANPAVFGGCSGPVQSLNINVRSTGTLEFLKSAGINQCPATGSYSVDLSYTGTISYPVIVNVQYTIKGSTSIGTIIVADPTAKLDIPASIDFLNNTTTDDTLRRVKITGVKDSSGDLTIKAKDTHKLTIWSRPAPSAMHRDFDKLKSICQGDQIVLDAGNGYSKYLWKNGSLSPTFITDTAGTYWVEVTNHKGCTIRDSIEVMVLPLPAINLGNDTMLCATNELVLDAGDKGTFYKWSNGATSQTIIAHEGDGQIWVKASDANGCVAADTIQILQCSQQQKLEIANAFTPNGDGHNDYWQIKGCQNYPKMMVKVYDRWGIEVFSSEHAYDKLWDGTSEGKNMPTGAYYYVIKLGDGSKQITGSLTLIR